MRLSEDCFGIPLSSPIQADAPCPPPAVPAAKPVSARQPEAPQHLHHFWVKNAGHPPNWHGLAFGFEMVRLISGLRRWCSWPAWTPLIGPSGASWRPKSRAGSPQDIELNTFRRLRRLIKKYDRRPP